MLILIGLEKKQLERKVSRKDKALAETATLLTLSKKSPRVSNDNTYAESIFKTMRNTKSMRNHFQCSREIGLNTHELLFSTLTRN